MNINTNTSRPLLKYKESTNKRKANTQLITKNKILDINTICIF